MLNIGQMIIKHQPNFLIYYKTLQEHAVSFIFYNVVTYYVV
jgi:hypothetical protein